MKKLSKTFVVMTAAVAFVFAGAGSALAVVNGDFETGNFFGWEQFPTAPGQQFIVSPGATGMYAGCIDNQQTTSGSVIKNANRGVGVVGPGSMLTISFDARGAGAAGGVAFAELFSEIAGGGTSASEILGGGPLALDPDPNVWTSYSFNAMAGPDVSGGVTVQFAAVTGADPNSEMFLCVDNVVLKICTVPTKQSNWGMLKGSFK